MICEISRPEGFFIECVCFFSAASLVDIRNQLEEFSIKRDLEADASWLEDLQNSSTRLAVLSMYAQANVMIPVSFDTIFEIGNPENAEHTFVEIEKAIWNGNHIHHMIEMGHKHILILDFLKGKPELINQLAESRSNYQRDGIRLGLCDAQDWEFIKKKNVETY